MMGPSLANHLEMKPPLAPGSTSGGFIAPDLFGAAPGLLGAWALLGVWGLAQGATGAAARVLRASHR